MQFDNTQHHLGLNLEVISPVLLTQLLNQSLHSNRTQYCLLPPNLTLWRPHSSRERQNRTRQKWGSPISLSPSLTPPSPPALLNLKGLQWRSSPSGDRPSELLSLPDGGGATLWAQGGPGVEREQTLPADPVQMEHPRAAVLRSGAALSPKLPLPNPPATLTARLLFSLLGLLGSSD